MAEANLPGLHHAGFGWVGAVLGARIQAEGSRPEYSPVCHGPNGVARVTQKPGGTGRTSVVAATELCCPCSVQGWSGSWQAGEEDASTVFGAHSAFWLVPRVTVAAVGGMVAS